MFSWYKRDVLILSVHMRAGVWVIKPIYIRAWIWSQTVRCQTLYFVKKQLV